MAELFKTFVAGFLAVVGMIVFVFLAALLDDKFEINRQCSNFIELHAWLKYVLVTIVALFLLLAVGSIVRHTN